MLTGELKVFSLRKDLLANDSYGHPRSFGMVEKLSDCATEIDDDSEGILSILDVNNVARLIITIFLRPVLDGSSYWSVHKRYAFLY